LAADQAVSVTLRCGSTAAGIDVDREPRWCSVTMTARPADVVNSAGVDLLAGGYGADRGYLEVDAGQYDAPAEVFAWSGASALLSRAYLDSAGAFEERYFLYYEDLDLAWRGRLRGWRHVYVPASVARHVHAASTGLASPLQSHYVERNRLLTLVRDAPAGLAWSAAVRFVLITLSYFRRDVLSRLLHARRPSVTIIRRRGRSFVAFVGLVPGALAARRRLRRDARLTDQDVRDWMVTATERVVGTGT
jgi:hypothetical protein